MFNIKKVLYAVCGFFAFFLIAILYSFLDSAVHTSPELSSPATYGLSSLEYEADPVMYLTVWQRNEKDLNDYDIPSYAPFYYEKTELILKEGETMLSITDPSVDHNDPYVGLTFTAEYDGEIRGQYDIMRPENLFYGGDSDKVPKRWVGTTEYLTNDDSTFIGNKSVTFNIHQYALNNHDYYMNNDKTTPTQYAEKWLQEQTTTETFDEDSFFEMQNFLEVYPDAPEVYNIYERSITTTCLTINAMHTRLPDVVVATAVIQIKTYSNWDAKNEDILRLNIEDAIAFYEYPNVLYSEITVLSYEQSDSFSWEQ